MNQSDKITAFYAGVIIGTKKSKANKARKHWVLPIPIPN